MAHVWKKVSYRHEKPLRKILETNLARVHYSKVKHICHEKFPKLDHRFLLCFITKLQATTLKTIELLLLLFQWISLYLKTISVNFITLKNNCELHILYYWHVFLIFVFKNFVSFIFEISLYHFWIIFLIHPRISIMLFYKQQNTTKLKLTIGRCF